MKSITDIVLDRTGRGFQEVTFTDGYGEHCSIQASSVVGDYPDAARRPGTSALWIGVPGSGQGRMHVDRAGVEFVVNVLSHWLKTGELYTVGEEP